jgi:hypothetical protein
MAFEMAFEMPQHRPITPEKKPLQHRGLIRAQKKAAARTEPGCRLVDKDR